MATKAYMGTKIDEEKKQRFLMMMQEKGMNQSQGIEYAIDRILGGDEDLQSPEPRSYTYETETYDEPTNTENSMEEYSEWEEDDQPAGRDELVTSGYDDIDPVFPNNPIRSEQLECEIRNAWRTASQDTSAAPEVIFLEELSERCLKLANAREEYTCPAVDIALPDRIVEFVEIIAKDAFQESSTGEASEVLDIMSNLAQSKAARMYNSTRKVEISFSRHDWRLIDRMIARENRTRSKESQIKGLRELIYEFLSSKVKERSASGFFSSSDREMIELAEGLQKIAITGENRNYE